MTPGAASSCSLSREALGAVLRFVGRRARARPASAPGCRGARRSSTCRGSFVLGLLTGLVTRGHAGGGAASSSGTGLLGGYTTFSTASVETVRLLQQRRYAASLGYGLGVLVLSVAAALLGLAARVVIRGSGAAGSPDRLTSWTEGVLRGDPGEHRALHPGRVLGDAAEHDRVAEQLLVRLDPALRAHRDAERVDADLQLLRGSARERGRRGSRRTTARSRSRRRPSGSGRCGRRRGAAAASPRRRRSG